MAVEMKFEDALKKVEKIVADLESGDLSLDDSLKKYEEGVKLAQFCSKKLESARKKVEILVKSGAGKLEARPFNEASLKED
jgi:exodeoxyribonuclease VII small subunit